MTALDPELAQLVGNKKTQVDPELARLVAATPGVTPFPKAIAGLKRPGERVTATEIDEDLWRVMSPEQRDKALSRMEQTQLANVRKAEKGRALVEKFRRQQETKKAIGKVVTTPVNYALKAMLAPPGAVVKAIGEGARQARAGKAIGLADLGRYALQGAKEGTSLQEYKQELFPGRSPLEQTVLALAGDVTSGYAAVPVARGIAAGAKLVKPLVGAAAEATPFVGDVVRAGKQYQVMRQGIRAERLAELKRVQPIEALFDLRVRPHIETLASDITKTQGKVTNPAVQAPALTFDLAAARGNLARAKAREAAANKIVGRIEKQQRLGVQPTADIRQARGEYEEAIKTVRAHEATEPRVLTVAKAELDKAASLRSEASQWRAKARNLRESGRYQVLSRARDIESGGGAVMAPQFKAELENLADRIAEYDGRSKDAMRAANDLASTGSPKYNQARQAFAKTHAELMGGVRDTGSRYQAVIESAEAAKTAQAVPLPVARARGVQARLTGGRAAAQTNLDRLRQTMKSQGRVPLSLRGVTFRLPQPGEKITEADTRNLIAALTERASPSGMALTPADAERELLGYADSLGLDTVKLQKAAAQARGLGKLYQSRIVAANVKTWDELQRIERQGGYLRRVYGRHLSEAEHLQWLDENGMRNVADRIRNARMNQPEIFYARAKAPVTKWNPRGNLPVKAQVALRPITDVIARLRAQTTVTKQILPRMEMFQRMAANPEMVGDVERTGWYYLSRSELTQRAERLRNLGWTDVADEVQSQAERNGWGALEGKYVSPQLYFALNPQSIDWGAKARDLPRQFANFAHSMLAPSIVHVPPSRVGAAGLYSKSLHAFKGLATVYNLPGQVANKIGNWMQVHAFGEVPASLVVPLEAAAAIDVARSSPFFYEVSKRLGSLAETGSLTDIMDTVQTIQRANTGEQSAIKTIALWAKNAPGKFWQMNEVTSKMAVIRYWLARGKSWDWAVNKAEAAVYHYSDVPRWIEWSRSFNPFLPFPTYAYKSVGQFWNAMWHHPDRINMYSRLKQAIESKTPKDERDAMNALLPDWEQEELPIILPGKDKYGRRQVQRSGRLTPWGSITPGDVFGRNPAIIGPLQELRTGKDEFGRDIANPEATTAEQIIQRGAHLVTGVVPSLRPLEAFLKERKLAKERELKPERKPEKEPRTTLQTLTRVGVLDTPIARKAALGKLQNDLANLKKYQRDLEKTKGKGFASWERDDPDRARIMARRITIAEERRKVNAAARKLRSNH